MPSQEILKIRDGTPLEAEGILTYRKKPSKLLEPSQEILKICDGTPLEAEGILTYRTNPRNCSVWHYSSKLDVPSNVVQKKRVARILVFKIRPSQEILKIRDGTPLEAEGILTYRKKPSKLLEILKICDGTPLEKKRVARILVFKIRPSQEILKIRDGTPLEAEGILTYRKSPRNCSVWHFSSKLDVTSNVVHKKRVARIMVFKIRPSQENLKIRDGTPLEAEGILTYRKKPSKLLVARILVFKIRPSQEILKIRDGTPLEAEGILTYRKKPSKLLGLALYSKLDVPSNVVQKKRVARILFSKIRPSQEILKIRDGTPLEAEGILTYRKKPSKLLENLKIRDENLKIRDEILKIRDENLKIRDGTPLEMPSQEILKIRDDVPSNVVQKKRVARILVFKIRPSQEILKIRDGTPLEAEGILTYRKSPRNCSVWHFSSKLDVTSNVVQKKRVAQILVSKIRPSQEILKIRDGTPLEAEGILTYRKKPSKLLEILKIRDGTPLEAEGILTYRKKPSKLLENLKIRDGTPLEAEGILTYRKKPSKLLVARILVFKIRPSQEILKIRDGTPLEAEGILTYRKKPSKLLGLALYSKLDVPSNVVQKKRVARILVSKIRPSQEILKIRDGTPLEAEGILTYRKKPSKLLENLKIRDEILKIRDDVPSNVVQKKRVARILVFKIRPSQEILKIRDGTPLEAEGILTYRKSPRNCSVWHFSSKLDVTSNVVHKKRVARIMVFKIRPSKENLKIRDGTPLEAEGILTYRKKPSKLLVARILVFKIRPSQEILKIRDGTPLEAEGILTYRKKPSKLLGLALYSKLDVPSNVVQKKRVARILVSKIRPSQEILKNRDGTPLEAEGILTYRKKPSKLLEILKIRDGTPLEAEGILTYRKNPRNCSVWHFSSKLDVTSNVVHKKRVARIMVFKIRPSQENRKIRDGTPLEAEGILTYRKKPSKLLVARILVFKIRPSQEILKIRDGTPLEAEGILTYRKKPSKLLGLALYSKLDVPSNVVQKKRVAQILVSKIRPSQEILKIRDGTPLEAEGILTYRKKPSKLLEILKIRDGTPLEMPSQENLKIRDGTPLEKKRVARILVFKIRPSQEILKIRDGTPLEAEGILTYRKKPSKLLGLALYSKLDVPSNVVQKKRVARILVSKIRPSQEILKIRDGTPLEAEGILTYRKKPSKLLGLALF
ncbi:hypothetical protein OROMI_029058 [Orobanche minor]